MANVLGLFFIGILPTTILLYYLAQAAQLQHLSAEERTIAYVVIMYLLGILATCLHLRWYEKHIAHVFEPQKPHEE